MTAWLDAWTIAWVVAGCVFLLAGTVGLLRFPDALTRMHALTKADNLGVGCIVLGLLPRSATFAHALKLLVVWALVLVASAVVSQLVAPVVRDDADAPPR